MVWPLVAAAAIGGVASIAGARTQANAADRASDAQQAQYQQTREDLEPYRDAGQTGLNAYLSELGFGEDGAYNPTATPDMSLQALSQGFQNSPGYDYSVEQMQKAIQNSAAARGNLHSGATQLELMRHTNGLASQDYWNYVNANRQGVQDNFNARQSRLSRLESLANTGAQAATQTGQFGANAATNAGNLQLHSAAASASGIAGAANAATSGISNHLYLDALQQGNATPASAGLTGLNYGGA